MGITCDNWELYFDINSAKKLDVNEPNRKKMVNTKKVAAAE
jgi:hypothetical protein